MEFFRLALLALIQGVTEFLPVSSSGHHVVFSHFLDLKEDSLLTSVFLHFGTLIAILIVFWRDILNIVLYDWKTVFYVIVATVPAILVALFFKDRLETAFSSFKMVGFAFLFTGTVLVFGSYMDNKRRVKSQLDIFRSIGIGIAQAIALIPGVSRSGSTISAGSVAGLDRQNSARFAFILAVPAIAGATLLEIIGIVKEGVTEKLSIHMLAGMVISAIVGYISLRVLLRVVNRGKLGWFSIYCYCAGFVTILYTLITS